MSSNKSSEKEESSQELFINIPPLSGTEEEVMEAERITLPGSKDKGLQQSELFETQKLMNGIFGFRRDSFGNCNPVSQRPPGRPSQSFTESTLNLLNMSSPCVIR